MELKKRDLSFFRALERSTLTLSSDSPVTFFISELESPATPERVSTLRWFSGSSRIIILMLWSESFDSMTLSGAGSESGKSGGGSLAMISSLRFVTIDMAVFLTHVMA